MPDIADARADFTAALRRSEEAAGITRDAEGNEQYAEETPVAIPELEGAVPVQASEQPLEPEAAQQPPEEPAAVTPEPEAPAAPTVDDPQERLAVAQARLEEKESFIGRQSSEIGELRKAIEEMQARLQAPAPAAPTPSIQITQELIDENPAAAVQAAFEQRNEQVLELAFEAWKDPLSGDPFAAATWLNDRKLEQQQAAFDARLADHEAKIQTVTAPLAQNAEQAQWSSAFDEVKATRPDFIENAERLLTEVAPKFPALTAQLSTGDAKVKAEALAALYALDKFGNPETVRQQLDEQAQEAAAEAAAARAAAGVVTGQSTTGQSSDEKTTEELEKDRYIARQQARPSLATGWTGRA